MFSLLVLVGLVRLGCKSGALVPDPRCGTKALVISHAQGLSRSVRATSKVSVYAHWSRQEIGNCVHVSIYDRERKSNLMLAL